MFLSVPWLEVRLAARVAAAVKQVAGLVSGTGQVFSVWVVNTCST